VSTPEWAPDNIPTDRPSAARMYDYFLGGYHNFEIDRRAAEAAIAIYPDFALVMRANRAFLRRAVEYLVAQGVDQFLDIGSGIPTVGNVHEVAQRANPAARVVYVDIDPIAVAHSQTILQGSATATIIQADVLQPETIVNHPEVRRLLDSGKPVGLLLVSMIHFITDDAEAYRAVRALGDALPSGSYLVLSHATYEGAPEEMNEPMSKLYSQTTNPTRVRWRAEIERFFAGFALVEPGVVYSPLWRPEGPDDLFLDQPERSLMLAGVGRKP
jgi:S-adenosyl methyltransferase